jgi:hypothetical protein
LIERTGALDVYFEDPIEFLMPIEEPPSEEAVREVLTESEIKFTRIAKGTTL